jgi:serine/threonine-protein kinase
MGEVYRARDPRLNRDVAIKVSAAQFSERFEREAKAIAALNHPNICQIYDVGPNYLVMEFIEGEAPKGPMPLDEGMRIARQIADALEAAHEKGITHRDLKPGNIKVKPDGTVKVLDFGLAKIHAGPASSGENSPTLTIGMTQAGMILGTAAYMAPEQARGKESVDKRADIWAFGVVLYELLTGKRLFEGEDVGDTLASVIKEQPNLDEAPAQVRPLLKRCLEKDPKKRLRDIGDVWLLLADKSAESAPRSSTTTSRFGRLPWIVAAVVLAVSTVVALWAPWRAPITTEGKLIRLNADLGPDARLGAAYSATRATISPDGTRLLYSVRQPDGKQMLASRSLDKPAGSVIPGTEYGADPFFSPDGQWIGFFADGKLKKLSLNGGDPVTLAVASNPRGASWSEDGTIIAALTNTAGLYRIAASGGAPQPITQLRAGEVTHRWPQVLPGGRLALFTSSANISNYEGANIEVLTIKTGERRILQAGAYFGRYSASGHLLYVHGGSLFALPVNEAGEPRGGPVLILDDVASSSTSAAGQFDVSRTGIFLYHSGKSEPETWSLMGLDASGSRKIHPRLAKSGAYIAPRLSPDGRRLALAIEETKGLDIFVYDLQNDVLSRLTFSGQQCSDPAWAPDGKHIVFQCARGDSRVLLWMRSDGAGEAHQLLEGKASLVPRSISPDSRRLVYEQSIGTNVDIWTMPLDVTDPDKPKPGTPELFAHTAANHVQPAFSPDGRWMAFASDESGLYEVFVRPFPEANGGGKWQISSGGGKMPVWSRDGKNLFFEDLDNRIMVTGYAARGDSFTASKPKPWSGQQLATPIDDANFDVAPDGTTIEALVPPPAAEEDKASLHVTFLLNFFDELRRRVPAGGK